MRVGVVIVELDARLPSSHSVGRAALGADAAARPLGTADLGIGRGLARAVGVVEQGAQAPALEAGRGRQAAEVGEGRVDVDQFGEARRRAAVPLVPRCRHDQGDSRGLFEEGLFFQWPCSPRMNPWSLRKTTTVRSVSLRRSRASSSRPTWASMKVVPA